MRMRSRGLAVFALLPVVALTAAACQESYYDEPFGVLDLATTFDGGTRANPAAGLPTNLLPQAGFESTERFEYYDFGAVPALIKFDSATLSTEPQSVRVSPMYFFYVGAQGPALFSAPARDNRDGSDHIRGGKGVLNPTPRCELPDADPAACAEEKKRPYPIRARDLWRDPQRGGSASYQRPIVDVVPGDRLYTGLWEVVEIAAPPGYAPDDIKSLSTLKSALGSGDFKQLRTGKVINCPIVDERTYVARGVTDRATPHPLIEIWYRRKQGLCYLANGWETLGTPSRERFFAGDPSERLQTFDVDVFNLGAGRTATTELLVPIYKAYTPTIFTFSGATFTPTRMVANLITKGRPRRSAADPPGYSPIQWMWDYIVEPDYVIGGLRSLDELDLSDETALPFYGAPGHVVRNIAHRGVQVRCGYPPLAHKTGEPCGVEKPNPNGLGTIVDAKGDQVCEGIGLECNPDTCFCDAPAVGFGQPCGFGIARCSPEKDGFSDAGYTCFPADVGVCYLGCTGSNQKAAENEGRPETEYVDTRCKELPGYRCLGYNRRGICLKLCDENVSTPQCGAEAPYPTATDEPKDIGKGQVCLNLGIEVCVWPEGYTPSFDE